MIDAEYLEQLETDADMSWTFNDINLTMIIIVLFFAVIFATLVSDAEGESKSTITADVIENKPAQMANADFFGEQGFPKQQANKGFPSKDTFNRDLILNTADADREGMAGDKVWDFEELSRLQRQKFVQIQANHRGELFYLGEPVATDEMKDIVDELAQDYNVFVQLFIDKKAPVSVYERIRNYLWNDSSAVHWRFITE